WCRRRARSTALCGSRRRGWRNWSPPNGSTSADSRTFFCIISSRGLRTRMPWSILIVAPSRRRHWRWLSRRRIDGAVSWIKHRAARCTAQPPALAQTGNDPVHVRYLCPPQPKYIGRAGHLLLHGSAILLWKDVSATRGEDLDRNPKAQDNPVRSHVRLSFDWHALQPVQPAQQASQSNEV